MAQQILPMINVEKLYVARVLTDTPGSITFDTPKYLQGVKEIGVKPKEDSAAYYAEGVKVLEELTLSDITVTVNITDLSAVDQAYCLGHTQGANGGIIKNSNDIAPEVAFLFECNKAKGVNRYVALYCGILQEPDIDIKSKEGKVNFQSLKLQASFRPLSNGLWSYGIDSDDPNSNTASTIQNFFTAVTLPTPATSSSSSSGN